MKLGYQGNASRLLEDWVWNEWRGVVLSQVARLILAYVCVGLLLGAWMGAGLWALRVRRRVVFWGSALACLAVEVPWVLADMASHPHLYAATLYERAGWTKALLLALSGQSPTVWRAVALGPVVAVLVALGLRAVGRTPRWGYGPAALGVLWALAGRGWSRRRTARPAADFATQPAHPCLGRAAAGPPLGQRVWAAHVAEHRPADEPGHALPGDGGAAAAHRALVGHAAQLPVGGRAPLAPHAGRPLGARDAVHHAGECARRGRAGRRRWCLTTRAICSPASALASSRCRRPPSTSRTSSASGCS